MNTDPQHLISLFENATEGIILTGGNANIMLVNPAAEKLFGYSAAELVGRPIEILIPDKSRHHHHELREGFYNHPSNRVMGQNRDLFGRRKDGVEIPLEVSLSHYRRDEQLYVIAFIVDIARRKEIEASMIRQQKELQKISSEIRKLNADLERKVEERTVILKEALQRLEDSQIELSEALNKEKMLNEIKGRFVSMASHEFRTPLSTVLSSASLLSRYTTTDEQDKRNRHIEKIKNSVKHLNDVLEDFLSLGKLDEGKVSIHTGDFDLQEFVNDVVDEMKGFAKNEQLIDYCHIGNSMVFSDKKLLKNIMINLIGNAIKFSNEGCPVIIRSSTNEDLAVISISDQGIGISKDDLEHLFSSFFRAANAINIQGTGLGLHIVKRYVDLLNGEVKVESELNKGTTITLTIPITKEAL